MKQNKEKLNYRYISLAVLAGITVFGLLWFFDLSSEPEPIGASAQTAACTPQAWSSGAIKLQIGHEPQKTFKQNEQFTSFLLADFGSKDHPCMRSPGVKVRFTYQTIKDGRGPTSRSTDESVTYGPHPETQNNAFEVEFSASWDDLFPDETFSSGAKTEAYAEIWFNGSVVRTTQALDTIPIVASGQPNPNINKPNVNIPNINSPGGGNNLPTGGSSGNCGQYFTFDAKTGLCIPKGPGGGDSLANSGDVYTLASRVIRIMLTFAGITAVIFVIIGGYMYITSAGNEEQAGKGRKTITYALIGLIVVLLAFVIVALLSKFITTGS